MSDNISSEFEPVSFNALQASCNWRNDSDSTASEAVRSAERILTPIWLILCTVGNVLNILVLRTVSTYHATWLLAMAVFDLLAIWSHCISYYIFELQKSDDADILRSAFVFLTTADVGITSSDWTLLLFNLSHLISVLFPLKSRMILTSSRIRTAIVVLMVLAVTTWLVDYIKAFSLSDNYALRLHGRWLMEWSTVHAKGTSFVIVFTFFAILASNLVVILFLLCRYKAPPSSDYRFDMRSSTWKLRTFNLSKSNSTGSSQILPSKVATTCKSVNPPKRRTRHGAAVRMLVMSSCMNAILKAPLVLYEILENLCAYRVPDSSMDMFYAIRIHSYSANYSLGFFVYCLINPDYGRKAWKIVAGCCRTKAGVHVQHRHLTQQTSTSTFV